MNAIRPLVLYSLAVLLVCERSLAADNVRVPQQDSELRPVVVAVVGHSMTNLLVEVVHHIAGETSQHVRLLSEDTELKMSPEKQARDISQKLEKRDLLAIVLLNFPEDKATFRSAYFPRERVALIDVGWLRQTGEPGQELDEVRLRSRFMKEALRALGKLLGMKDCPFPRCCMQLSSTYIELDSKAMDFCPPCQAVAESALAEAHSR